MTSTTVLCHRCCSNYRTGYQAIESHIRGVMSFIIGLLLSE